MLQAAPRVLQKMFSMIERRAMCMSSSTLRIAPQTEVGAVWSGIRQPRGSQMPEWRCFSTAPLASAQPQETQTGIVESPGSHWLDVDSRPRKATQYTEQAQGDEAHSSSLQSAEPSSSAADRARPVLYLDKEDDASEDDLLGPIDWSDSEPESEQQRQTRFSPTGPKPKIQYTKEKKRKGIGRAAVIPPLPDFDAMVARLQAYKDRFGDCMVPKRYWEDFELGDWSFRMRAMLKDKILPTRKFEVLDAMGFPWTLPLEVVSWEIMYHEMRRYNVEHGNLDVPFKWKDPMADFNNHFARWFHAQPTLFLQRRLRPDQVRKLMLAGYDMQKVTGDTISKADYVKAQKEIAMSGDRAEFEIMFAELEAWKANYYTTIIPRMVYDNPVLGMWAWKVRRDYRRNSLAQWKVDRLEGLEFLWKVDVITAKWHHNLHEARRYKEAHGTGNIPVDYVNPAEPAWQEASRWLHRQAKLFRKQKLSDKRYRIMREVLGIKFVRQYAPRVAQNRKRMGIQAGRAKRLPKYAPPLKKNVLV